MNLPFFAVKAYVPGGVQNQAEKNSKNAFRPVPVQKFTFPVSGVPNANTKSQRFSYAISQIAPLPLVVALNRSVTLQIAARLAAFWHATPQIALDASKSQRFKSQRLRDANATKSQTLALYKNKLHAKISGVSIWAKLAIPMLQQTWPR